MSRTDRVLVALDESAAAWRALKFALHRAAQCNARLTVLSVLDSRAATLAVRAGGSRGTSAGDLTERLEALFQQAHALAGIEGVSIETLMTASSTDSADGIVRAAREGAFDEIVMGHREKRGLEKVVLGSTAMRVLATCDIPVTIVP